MLQCFCICSFPVLSDPNSLSRRSPSSLVQLEVFSDSFNGVEQFPFNSFQSSIAYSVQEMTLKTVKSVGHFYQAIVQMKLYCSFNKDVLHFRYARLLLHSTSHHQLVLVQLSFVFAANHKQIFAFKFKVSLHFKWFDSPPPPFSQHRTRLNHGLALIHH